RVCQTGSFNPLFIGARLRTSDQGSTGVSSGKRTFNPLFIGARLRTASKEKVRCADEQDSLSISSSSGHVFAQVSSAWSQRMAEPFNPLFIGARLRTHAGGGFGDAEAGHDLSIPSSSGHVFAPAGAVAFALAVVLSIPSSSGHVF